MNDNSHYSIFDHLIEGIQVIDFEHKYHYVNEVVADQAKSSVEELTGHKMYEKFPGIEHTEVFKVIDHCLQKRESHRMLNEFDFPDGSKGYFELKFNPVVEGVLVMSIDVTDVKKAEKIIDDHNKILLKEVEEKTAEIIQQKQTLERERNSLQLSNEKLEEFNHIISHDLRNPLKYIESIVTLIKADIDAPVEKLIKRLDVISVSATGILELINDLSYYAKSTEVDNAIQKVPLFDMFNRIKNSIQDSENIVINIPESEVCYVDGSRFRQALYNFIANGLKYNTSDNKQVLITYDNVEKLLSISDNGIGIAQENFENIFKIFYTSSPGTIEPGKGMGMAIAKKILDRHQIDIQLKSSSDRGTTFILDLKNVTA